MYNCSAHAAHTPCNQLVKIILSALLALGLSAKAFAINHDELSMNGIASNWVLNNELYVAALFLETLESDPQKIFDASGRKRMEFRITTDKWRERNFKKTWARSISINVDDATQKLYSREIIRFSNMLKGPLLYGDKVTIDYTPRKHTRAYINGVQVFYTSKSAFFNALLSAWIGARPPSSDFKTQILKIDRSNMDTQDVLSRYDFIRPDLENQRKKEIQAWVAPAKTSAKPSVKKTVAQTAPVPTSTTAATTTNPQKSTTNASTNATPKKVEVKQPPTPATSVTSSPKPQPVEPSASITSTAKTPPANNLAQPEPEKINTLSEQTTTAAATITAAAPVPNKPAADTSKPTTTALNNAVVKPVTTEKAATPESQVPASSPETNNAFDALLEEIEDES
jgi:hypothetical protein